MKKIFLICPAETGQMPYLDNYTNMLEELGLEYDYIIWDRQAIMPPEAKGNIFRDGKNSLRRGFFDYLQFAIFYRKLISKYDHCLVFAFGIPTLFFMNQKLVQKNTVIADIRDHHMLYFLNPFFDRLLKSTRLNVLSSPAFTNWLPKKMNYVINHNTVFNKNCLKKASKRELKNNLHKISCIGALKDFSVLKELLVEANSRKLKEVKFLFHGEGVINKKLENLSFKCTFINIKITGRYAKSDEEQLYEKSDWINMFMSVNNINNRSCLSNRLYNSVYYGKPLLCYEGSYISEIVKRYNLGIVFSNVKDFFDTFQERAKYFNYENYNIGRLEFFDFVDRDNEIFYRRLKSILAEFK